MGSLPGTSTRNQLEYGFAEIARNKPLPRRVQGRAPDVDRRAGGAREPRDVLNTQDPVSWAARWAARPAEAILCPPADGMGCHDIGPHVHDRTGRAHPVTPDGRWAITRPDPPTRSTHPTSGRE